MTNTETPTGADIYAAAVDHQIAAAEAAVLQLDERIAKMTSERQAAALAFAMKRTPPAITAPALKIMDSGIAALRACREAMDVAVGIGVANRALRAALDAGRPVRFTAFTDTPAAPTGAHAPI